MGRWRKEAEGALGSDHRGWVSWAVQSGLHPEGAGEPCTDGVGGVKGQSDCSVDMAACGVGQSSSRIWLLQPLNGKKPLLPDPPLPSPPLPSIFSPSLLWTPRLSLSPLLRSFCSPLPHLSSSPSPLLPQAPSPAQAIATPGWAALARACSATLGPEPAPPRGRHTRWRARVLLCPWSRCPAPPGPRAPLPPAASSGSAALGRLWRPLQPRLRLP